MSYDLEHFVADCRAILSRDPGPTGREEIRLRLERLLANPDFVRQYCGDDDELTFDHVVPRSKGGLTTWENVVAACSHCNLKKGDMLPAVARMWPATAPFQPTIHDLHQNGRLFPPNYLHESWMDYLYWDSELEP